MARRIFEDSEGKYPAKKKSRVREEKKGTIKLPKKEAEDAPLEPVLASEGDLEMIRKNQRQAEARKRGEGNGVTIETSVPITSETASEIVDAAPLEVAPQAIIANDAEKVAEDAKIKEEEWRAKYDSLIDQRLYSGDNWIQIRDHNFSTREFKIFSNLEAWHKKIISQDDLDKLLEEYKLPQKKDSRRRFVKETKMNVEEALRDIELKKGERLRAIAKGDLEKEWAEDAHEMFVFIPKWVEKSFDLMPEGDRKRVIEALDAANKEIESAWNVWKKGQKRKEAVVEAIPEEERVKISKEDWDAAGERLMGELDKASGASKKSPAVESVPEGGAEKELSPEDSEFLRLEAVKLWEYYSGLYLKYREHRKEPILFNEVASDIEDLIEGIVGYQSEKTREQADKIVKESLEK